LFLIQFQNCFSQNITEIQQVSSVCNWKPPKPKAVSEINKPLPTTEEDIFKFLDYKYVEPKYR
jgi:hypothetical protein